MKEFIKKNLLAIIPWMLFVTIEVVAMLGWLITGNFFPFSLFSSDKQFLVLFIVPVIMLVCNIVCAIVKKQPIIFVSTVFVLLSTWNWFFVTNNAHSISHFSDVLLSILITVSCCFISLLCLTDETTPLIKKLILIADGAMLLLVACTVATHAPYILKAGYEDKVYDPFAICPMIISSTGLILLFLPITLILLSKKKKLLSLIFGLIDIFIYLPALGYLMVVFILVLAISSIFA